MKVSTIMTAPAKSCEPDTNLASVVQIMWENDCGAVAVVNDRGEAIGIVTDRDICVALGTRNARPASITARDLMTQSIVGCAPEDDCFIVLRAMEQHKVRRLPVLGIGGVLLGMISMNDIVARAAKAPPSDPLRTGVVEALSVIGTQAAQPRVAAVGR